MLTYRQISLKIFFCLQSVLHKKKVSQAQSNWFSIQGAATYLIGDKFTGVNFSRAKLLVGEKN